MSRKHTIEYIKRLFCENNVNFSDVEYRGYNSPVEFVCKCGNKHKISPANLVKRGVAKCKDCSRRDSAGLRSLNKNEVFSFISSLGYRIISTTYVNSSDKLSMICPKGHSIFTSFRSFRQNHGKCRKCSYENISGENSPLFIHGRSKQERYDRNKCRVEHNKWKRELLQKYHYKCVICNKKDGRNLCAHHLNGYNWDVENRYNTDNGILLCKLHHNLFHGIFGKGGNTREQFIDFAHGLRTCKYNPWIYEEKFSGME